MKVNEMPRVISVTCVESIVNPFRYRMSVCVCVVLESGICDEIVIDSNILNTNMYMRIMFLKLCLTM